MRVIPKTFKQALRTGYRVVGETSKLTPRGRTGHVRLRNSLGRKISFPYTADLKGYTFGPVQS